MQEIAKKATLEDQPMCYWGPQTRRWKPLVLRGGRVSILGFSKCPLGIGGVAAAGVLGGRWGSPVFWDLLPTRAWLPYGQCSAEYIVWSPAPHQSRHSTYLCCVCCITTSICLQETREAKQKVVFLYKVQAGRQTWFLSNRFTAQELAGKVTDIFGTKVFDSVSHEI